MKDFLAVVVAVSLMVVGVHADSECYSCNACAPTFLSFTYDKVACGLGGACYKEIEDDGDVNRGCIDVVTCTAKAIIPGECRGDTGPCMICCTGDECNASAMTTVSMTTMLLSLVAVFFARYA